MSYPRSLPATLTATALPTVRIGVMALREPVRLCPRLPPNVTNDRVRSVTDYLTRKRARARQTTNLVYRVFESARESGDNYMNIRSG